MIHRLDGFQQIHIMYGFRCSRDQFYFGFDWANLYPYGNVSNPYAIIHNVLFMEKSEYVDGVAAYVNTEVGRQRWWK